LATVLAAPAWAAASDDTVRVFPTYAYVDGDSVNIPVHVWVYEHENDLLRRAAIEPLEALVAPGEGEEAVIFERRALDFMVDNERGEEVVASVRGPGLEPTSRVLGETPANGHLETVLTVPFSPIPGAVRYRFDLTIQVGEITQRVAVPLIPKRGVSVVSDIDDTIKVTNVLDKKELLANSFTREFREVDGMSAFFERLRTRYRPAFHYLSASPWNLYRELDAWRVRAGFPDATWHLRIFRIKEIERTARFLRGSEGHKVKQLETLFRRFPERTFILVGDSGEGDPEVYGRMARAFPARIEHIYIREVPGAANGADRFAEAFREFDTARWTTFPDPSKLPE
jgi:phosphatidate phosphatase APP1